MDLYEHQENLLKMEKSSERLTMGDNLKVNFEIKNYVRKTPLLSRFYF